MFKYAALFLFFSSSIARAGECDRWNAAMQDDEGGPVMTASICAGVGEKRVSIVVQCGGEGSLALRYNPESGFQPSDPEYKTPLTFTLDGDAQTRKGHYEAMDGALVVVLDEADPLPKEMAQAKALQVSAPGNPFEAQTFSLAGSAKALQKLKSTCK